jgi:ATP-binding cassette subfamily B protein
MTIMNICAFAAAIFATEYHIAEIGTIYLVISYTLNVVSQLWSVSNATRNYLRIIGDAGPMIATLDEEIEIQDLEKPEECLIHDGKIEIQNMTFTHDENTKPLFDNFSLTINSGERVGLIGRSGSGKTSLTKLILRFNDIEKGIIKIDGQDITKITQDDLHNSIAYVSQEPALFHRSLHDNIAYSKPDASEAEVRYAAAQANALDFIQSLNKGFKTLVGERGVKLSGGQRQRVAIARAILKNAPILILDEATSALDSESEKLIQDSLSKLMHGRTSIVIAHRLSTISKLDRIIVLDEGKIVEQGTHEELIANSNIYAKLWAHQSGGFIEE